MKNARPKILALFGVALLIVAVATAGIAYAAGMFSRAAAPTTPMHYTVLVGNGQHDDFVNAEFTPPILTIYAGDSVTFRDQNMVEAHTVTFGPKDLVKKLAAKFVNVIPSHGPPTISLNSRVMTRTPSSVYTGGFANSGLLTNQVKFTKTSWTLTFPKPGRYEYWCIVHYPGMHGWIVVEPRPGAFSPYRVEAGTQESGNAIADTYFPEHQTVHVGDTVEFGAFFHTVTFAPSATIKQLRSHLVLRHKGKNGKTEYVFNPVAVLPSSRNGCGATFSCQYGGGFLNSGLLQGSSKGPSIFQVTFTRAGTYSYHCLIHRGMDGTITVLPAMMTNKT